MSLIYYKTNICFVKFFKMRKNVQIKSVSTRRKLTNTLPHLWKFHPTNCVLYSHLRIFTSKITPFSISFMLKYFVSAESKFWLWKFPAINMPPCVCPPPKYTPSPSPPPKKSPPKRAFEIYESMVLYTGFYGLCISFLYFGLFWFKMKGIDYCWFVLVYNEGYRLLLVCFGL